MTRPRCARGSRRPRWRCRRYGRQTTGNPSWKRSRSSGCSRRNGRRLGGDCAQQTAKSDAMANAAITTRSDGEEPDGDWRRLVRTWPGSPDARAWSGLAADSPWLRSRQTWGGADGGNRDGAARHGLRGRCGRSRGAWRNRGSCCTSSMRTISIAFGFEGGDAAAGAAARARDTSRR